MLNFYEFWYMIGQEHTHMCQIIFNWNLWNNSISLDNYQKHLRLIYHFEVLLECPVVLYEAQLNISMDVYPHKRMLCFNTFMKYWIFKNHTIWLVKRVSEKKTQPKNFAWHGNWNGKSRITIAILSYFFSGKKMTKFSKNYKISYLVCKMSYWI